MRKLSQSIALSSLVLGLVSGVPMLERPGIAQTIAQNSMSEIDAVIAEGRRLFKEGSAESLRKAIMQFERSLQLSQTAKALDKQALSALALGRIYSALGEKQQALESYNQALPLLRAVGDRGGEAVTLNNIGRVYDDLGEKQKALDYYNQALPLYRAVGDRDGEAKTLNNVAFVLADQKQPQLAIVFFKQSVSLYESLRQNLGIVN